MKLTKRHWMILAVVAVLAAAAYFAYRYYVLKQQQEGQNPQGLGSNLNSPAPEMNAAPSVGPAVEIPVTIDISHSSSEAPENEANPYRRMIGAPGNVVSPLAGANPGMRPATQAAGLFRREDMETDKNSASPYSTTMGPG
jgi:hypothetical protein